MLNSEKVIKKAISFPEARKIKYLGINLTKEVTNTYNENYKTLLKEIDEISKKWKVILCSWIERSTIFKMSILPKKNL